VSGFLPLSPRTRHQKDATPPSESTRSTGSMPIMAVSNSDDDPSPQVWSSGYSPKADFLEAIQEATEIAMAGLPKCGPGANIDLALVSVSSLYDGQASPATLVPAVLSTASTYGNGIQNLIGCTTGGIISSVRNSYYGTVGEEMRACNGIESEGNPGISIVLAILPDVKLKVSENENSVNAH
jgi:hypothetical protein